MFKSLLRGKGRFLFCMDKLQNTVMSKTSSSLEKVYFKVDIYNGYVMQKIK